MIFEGQVSLSTPFAVFLVELLVRNSEMHVQAHMLCDQHESFIQSSNNVHPFGYHFHILRMDNHPYKTSSHLL